MALTIYPVTNLYLPTGLLQKTWGIRNYPVEYTFDAQGRMKTMKIWQDFVGNTGVATTTWNYDAQRGWLTNKNGLVLTFDTFLSVRPGNEGVE